MGLGMVSSDADAASARAPDQASKRQQPRRFRPGRARLPDPMGREIPARVPPTLFAPKKNSLFLIT